MIRKVYFAILIIAISISGYAQNNRGKQFNYADPKEYEIAGIEISGVQYLDHQALISISGLSIGDTIPIPGYHITDAVKKFWEQGLFSDVNISASKTIADPNKRIAGKIFLDIYLQERPRLAGYTMHGIRKTETEDLEDKLSELKVGRQVTEDVINKTEHVIKSHFYEKGFYNTSIRITQKDDEVYKNSVDLNIYVDKGDKVKISNIIIDGNEKIEDKKLKRVMKKTREKAIINFRPAKFVEENYTEDKKNLLAKYNENGFRDAKIVADSVYFVEPDRVNVYIKVIEGRKYYFGDIKWIGNTVYTAEELNRSLKIKRGDVYDQALLESRLVNDIDAVGNLYLDNGYLFYFCTPVEQSIENDTINLEMRIHEGDQAEVKNIIINGNTKTKEHVVRRELYTIPGELFSKSDIMRTVREIAQLGHFDPEKINPIPLPNQVDGTVDIEYNLEEKPNDQVEISGGWGQGMFVGTLGLRFNNFSSKDMFKKGAWRPIPSGDGQQVSLRAQTNGKFYQSYSISFMEPWLGGKKPTSLSISLYHSVYTSMNYSGMYGSSYYNYGYSNPYYNASLFNPTSFMKITGFSVGTGKRLRWPDDYFTLYNEVSLQRYKLKDYNYLPGMNNGLAHNFNYKFVLSRNSSGPSPLYPTRGSDFSLTLQITPPYSMLDDRDSYLNLEPEDLYKFIEYHKWKFKANWYLNFVDKFVLFSRIEYGILGYYNREKRSIFETFRVGGDGMTGYSYFGSDIISQRGYENGTLTPSDGGNIYSKYTLEMRYPFTQSQQATIYAAAFLEGGRAWTNFEQFNPFNVKRAAGVGLRIFLPMLGLMGIDWGYGFDPSVRMDEQGNMEKSGGQFHFMIGQQF